MQEVKTMSSSEYRDLTPVDNIENGEEYFNALNWAFQNKKIKNIALTGPYGSGKSSLIESFLANDDETISSKGNSRRKKAIRKSALKISMATFIKGDYDKKNTGKAIEISADEVEEGILKQLFYKVEPRKIPQSRYRKIHAISGVSVFVHILIGLMLIGLFSAIFVPHAFEEFLEAIKDFLPSCLSAPAFTVVVAVLLLLLVATIGAYLYIVLISKFRVKEVKLPTDMTVQSGEEEKDSVFNRNLDEIIYFFESTGYRTVFFEDLDRLSDSTIFVHLRELNNLLNNDDTIKDKPIVFVYAVRDDIFSKEDRTKFFDFIIPVIPVINSTNSGEILLQRLQKEKDKGVGHDISQEFVLDVAPYISDMRILQNIYNEFIVYKKTLRISQGLELSDEQMFAMMIFKNLCPGDFADIQDEKGILKKAFREKNEFIDDKKKNIQNDINSHSEKITIVQTDTMKSIQELKYAMVGTIMGGFYRFDSFNSNSSSLPAISASKVMNDDFDMAELIQKNGYTQIKFYIYNYGNDSRPVDVDTLKSYVKRWKAIKELEERGLKKLQEDLQELRNRHHALSGMTLKGIIETYSQEEVLSDEIRKNKLLTFLLRRGYIDEKYANYINYFKGTSITKDDMNYILSVKNQSPLDFDYQLTKTAMVIERLQDYEFEQKAIYNFNLLEELLSNGSSLKLNVFITQLADGDEISWRFIDEFIDRTAHKEKFIRILAEKWTGMWKSIASNDTLTYERQLQYLRIMLNVLETADISVQNEDSSLACYFEQHDDILQKLIPCSTTKLISAIKYLDVSFNKLQIEGVPEEVLDCVFDGSYYDLNDFMIQAVVSYKNSNMMKMLEEKPYSIIVDLGYKPLMQYIHENIATYVREVVLLQSEPSDRAEDVVDMLIRLENEQELQVQLIVHEDFHLDSIAECAGEQVQADNKTWSPVWNALLVENIVTISWENIIAYWKVYKLSNELKKYISLHVDELAKTDTTAIEDEFVRMFIGSDLAFEVEKKLIPVLRMKNFNLDISSIEESTLNIMIDCNYFEFTVNHYSAVTTISMDLGVEFILKNQDEYMQLRESISMSTDLLNSLMLGDSFREENKATLFSEYAEEYMTENIAMQMNALNLPITGNIFDAAWECVEQEKRNFLLLANCTKLGADELEQRFREIGGPYAGFDDRTRRHDVTLVANPQNRLLAEHMQHIGYITSFEEVNDNYFDTVLEKETSRKILKLRIKQVK